MIKKLSIYVILFSAMILLVTFKIYSQEQEQKKQQKQVTYKFVGIVEFKESKLYSLVFWVLSDALVAIKDKNDNYISDWDLTIVQYDEKEEFVDIFLEGDYYENKEPQTEYNRRLRVIVINNIFIMNKTKIVNVLLEDKNSDRTWKAKELFNVEKK